MTTGKTIALTIQTFVGKVMSLPFTVLSLLITGGERANSFSGASVPDSSSHCWGLLLWPLQCPQQAEVGICSQESSQVAQWQRIHLPGQEMPVQSLSQEDALEKEMATHSSILAWV